MKTTPPPIPRPDRELDWHQFKALLRAYFTLNTRGHMSQPYGPQGKSIHFGFTLLIYVLFGFMTGIFIFQIKDLAAYLLIVHAMTFMMVLMLAILESNQVLFNPQEEDVLGHRPVGPRTLLAAKIANMISVTLGVALALNLAPTFFVLYAPGVYPWAPLAHLFTVCLICAFCAAGVVFIYGLVSRFVGRERFQAMVTWTQIAMMFMFTIGFQLVPRFIDSSAMPALKHGLPLLAPLPPVWFVGLEVTLASRQGTAATLLVGLLALAGTPLLCWGAVTRLAGLQGRISSSLMEQPAPAPVEKTVKAAPAKRLNPLLAAWLRDPVERGAFRLAATVMRRDRYVMQQLYPQLGFVVAYPLLMTLSGGHGRQGGGHHTITFLLFGTWMLGTLPITTLEIFRTAENPEAAGIFAIAPLAGAGRLFHGVRKAVLAYLVLPVVAALGGLGLLMHVPPDEAVIALPLLLVIPTLSLLPGVGARPYLPFSLPARRGNKAERVAAMFFTMILMGGLIGLVWFVHKEGWLGRLLLAEVPLLALIHGLMLRNISAPRPIRLEREVS